MAPCSSLYKLDTVKLHDLSKMSHLKVCQTRRIWIQVVNHTLPGSWQRQPPDQQDGQCNIGEYSGEIHHLKFQWLFNILLDTYSIITASGHRNTVYIPLLVLVTSLSRFVCLRNVSSPLLSHTLAVFLKYCK